MSKTKLVNSQTTKNQVPILYNVRFIYVVRAELGVFRHSILATIL